MRLLVVLVGLLLSGSLLAQDVTATLKEAANLERSLKENEALDKYAEVLKTDATNMKALIKCSELSTAIGARQADKKQRIVWYDKAKDYAEQALAADSNSADAHYVRALVADKYKETETENKKLVVYVREMKRYADKALALNANHGKANYMEGKWHYDIAAMPWAKRSALEALQGGIPNGSIDSAFFFMEKCKTLEPYFVANVFTLAKAYKFDNKAQKAVETLNLLVKLPTRTADDAAIKAEGKTMLGEME